MRSRPAPSNHFQVDHIDCLRRSLRHWTKKDLISIESEPEAAAEAIWNAEFVVLSHQFSEDPLLNYGNQVALDLFEITWEDLIRMPSRLTAEAPNRAERQRLLEKVSSQGYIDDYSGVRVSLSGQRFMIHQALVWTLINDRLEPIGQAATFSSWTPL